MFSTDYFEPWTQFSDPMTRQLAFAIASPNLLYHFPHNIYTDQAIEFHSSQLWSDFYYAYESRLHQLDHSPAELYIFLARIKSTRLGLRFEALLWFWLQDPANQYYQLLGHSIQSHHAGKTLGEIDFLLKNLRTGQIEHWEVCLKYYLAEPDLSLETWIGLNPDDTLSHKLNHLIHKQFQFQQALGQRIERRFVIMKGQLYLPATYQELPDWLNPQRRPGEWSTFIPQTTDGWRRLNRQEWLCPVMTLPLAHQPVIWWTDGLYYKAQQQSFLMLRLARYPHIFQTYS